MMEDQRNNSNESQRQLSKENIECSKTIIDNPNEQINDEKVELSAGPSVKDKDHKVKTVRQDMEQTLLINMNSEDVGQTSDILSYIRKKNEIKEKTDEFICSLEKTQEKDLTEVINKNSGSFKADEKPINIKDTTNHDDLHSKEAKHEEVCNPILANNVSAPQKIEVIEKIIKSERSDNKKHKLLIKLPDPSVTCERDAVGDDPKNRNEPRIACECDSNVEGAAVPIISSLESCPPASDPANNPGVSNVQIKVKVKNVIPIFTNNKVTSHETVASHSKSHRLAECQQGPLPKSPSKQATKILGTSNADKNFSSGIRVSKINSNIAQPVKSTLSVRNCKRLQSTHSISKTNTGRSEDSLRVDKSMSQTRCWASGSGLPLQDKPSDLNCESRSNLKRQSLIPKPSRPSSTNQKTIDLQKTTEKKETRFKRPSEQKLPNTSRLPSKTCDEPGSLSSRISRLAATTSVIRSKLDTGLKKQDNKPIKRSIDLEETNNMPIAGSNTMKNLYRTIFEVKQMAKDLSDANIMKHQKEHIERLLNKISDIQKIADVLNEQDSSTTSDSLKDQIRNLNQDSPQMEAKIKSTKPKDNKICIKVLQAKDKLEKKKKEQPTEASDEQTVAGPSVIPEPIKSETTLMEAKQSNKKLTDSDSMDGVFIPSLEPPINTMEEEEESNGLDITITFPEFKKFLNDEAESHLSVRLSDISAEALKKLKRCPKDFTLRMDFVQGKVLFQTGKAPANNFSIGPDKFVDNSIDSKKSDIISIKPITECSFASQLISVETIKDRNTSYKSLKSTDSELFNVVNLPHIYRNPSLNAVTRSCITLKTDRILSMAIMARQLHRSMPQIPSLTNIYEDKMIENFSKSVFQIQEKKRKSRANLRRGLTSSDFI